MDVYASVTNRILEAMERDLDNPIMPWHRSTGLPNNVESGNPYQGVNILNLWVDSQLKGYGSNVWGTYRQWQGKEAQVRKGEKSSLIVFYKSLTKENDDGEEETFRILKWSYVFNADQVDGYEEVKGEPIDRLEHAEEYVTKSGANIIHGGSRACYIPSKDEIHMPDEARFFGTDTSTRVEAYYATLFHELTHWTGPRVGRDLKGRFGDESYAMEELIAELGAAFQCAILGITPEPRLDHAQYIKNWHKVLKEDKKAIFTASARAQEAVTFLQG